jgi:hypothetical protein
LAAEDPSVQLPDDTAETPEIQVEQASQAPSEEAEANAEPTFEAPDLESAPTKNMAEESREQESPATPNALTFDEIEVKRLADVKDLLVEKEKLILAYTMRTVPKPYYDRWKKEANEVFRLLVRTRNRRQIEKPSES